MNFKIAIIANLNDVYGTFDDSATFDVNIGVDCK